MEIIMRLMRLKLPFTLTIFSAALLSATSPIHAEDVRIRTQFPSPYGTHGTASATDSSNFATTSGESQLAGGGGRVFVGQVNGTRKLNVTGSIAGRHTASVRHSNNWGVEFGGTGTVAAGGSVQANNTAGGGGTLVINSNQGNVGIGTTNPQFLLHVNGSIGISNGSDTGEMRVSRGTDGNFYNNYAP